MANEFERSARSSDKREKPDQYNDLSSEQLFDEGIRLFNEQDFYECHEALECLWNREKEPEKQFTQGVIQIAVGLYHAGRGNQAGAKKLIPRGLSRVRPFAPTHKGLAVEAFVKQVEAIQLALLGAESAATALSLELPKLTSATDDKNSC